MDCPINITSFNISSRFDFPEVTENHGTEPFQLDLPVDEYVLILRHKTVKKLVPNAEPFNPDFPDSKTKFSIEVSHNHNGCIRKAHQFSPNTPLTLILLKPSPLCDHDQLVITYSWGDGNDHSAQVEIQITQTSEVTEKPDGGYWKEFSDIAKNLRNMAEKIKQKRFTTVKLEVPENGELSDEGVKLKELLDLSHENRELTVKGYNVRFEKILTDFFVKNVSKSSSLEDEVDLESQIESEKVEDDPLEILSEKKSGPLKIPVLNLQKMKFEEKDPAPWFDFETLNNQTQDDSEHSEVVEKSEHPPKAQSPETNLETDPETDPQQNSFNSRKLQSLDTFGSSLRYVDSLLTQRYSFAVRRTPAHSPHFFNREAVAELQSIYPKEYELTSSHKIRQQDDMQAAFTYYYYILSEPAEFPVQDFFNSVDMDKSGVLSDQELRLLLSRSKTDLPLKVEDIQGFESEVKQCHLDHLAVNRLNIIDRLFNAFGNNGRVETYYDSEMPQVTLNLAATCDAVIDLFRQIDTKSTDVSWHNVQSKKYPSTEGDSDDVEFQEVTSNVTDMIAKLDLIKQQHKLFLCLQDSVNHNPENEKGNEIVYSLMEDFYKTMYPAASQFELPADLRNRYLDIRRMRGGIHFLPRLDSVLDVAMLLVLIAVFGMVFKKTASAMFKWAVRKSRFMF